MEGKGKIYASLLLQVCDLVPRLVWTLRTSMRYANFGQLLEIYRMFVEQVLVSLDIRDSHCTLNKIKFIIGCIENIILFHLNSNRKIRDKKVLLFMLNSFPIE